MIKAIHYTITKQTEKGLKEVMISKCNEGWIVEDSMGGYNWGWKQDIRRIQEVRRCCKVCHSKGK